MPRASSNAIPSCADSISRSCSCEANPFHPSLRLHGLKGRLTGMHSVSINLPYRITIELLLKDERIVPVNVGDHEEVY